MIAKDKQSHFIIGLIIALMFGHLFGVWIGLGVAAAAGIGKELRDMTGHGTPEWADLWFTIAGGVAGALILTMAR